MNRRFRAMRSRRSFFVHVPTAGETLDYRRDCRLPTTDETTDYRLDYRLLTTDYRLVRRFLLLYAASGAAALVYEVTWTRMLALQLGHTVAAASTVLAAFMGGLALGAWLAGYVSAGSLRTYAALEF